MSGGSAASLSAEGGIPATTQSLTTTRYKHVLGGGRRKAAVGVLGSALVDSLMPCSGTSSATRSPQLTPRRNGGDPGRGG